MERGPLGLEGSKFHFDAGGHEFQIEELLQRVRIGDPQVVADEHSKAPAAGQQVGEMGLKAVNSAGQHERNGNVHVRGRCKVECKDGEEGARLAGGQARKESREAFDPWRLRQ